MLRAYAQSTLFGERYGDGPVEVLWLHGWARAARDFAEVAGVLAARGVSSVALDLPGFGASPPPRNSGGARHYAQLIYPALEELSLEPLVIVGHSLGGRVATVVAARWPTRVRALVLTGVPLRRSAPIAPPPWRFRAARTLHRRGLISEERMESKRQRYGSPDYRNARGVVRDVLVAMVAESYGSELAALESPVSFVWGERDEVVPLDVARWAQSTVPGPSSLVTLEGVGHFVPTEAPDALAELVARLVPS